MAGQLRISVDRAQTVHVSFQCRVHIDGGLAGDDVELRLWQSAGVAPTYQARGGTTLDGNGKGIVVFDDVQLNGPCIARLVAEPVTAATQLIMDDVHIEVTP